MELGILVHLFRLDVDVVRSLARTNGMCGYERYLLYQRDEEVTHNAETTRV